MGNNISDISPVDHLPNLSLLDVRNNHILLLQPVETLLNLKKLRIEGNDIDDDKWLQHFAEEHPDVTIDVLQDEE